MKKLLIAVIVTSLFQGCTSKVEIPIRHAGVVSSGAEVNAKVLKPGDHLIDFGSEVILYDISTASLDIEFGFLFSDASGGKLKVAIEFNPIVDSLSAFYSKFQSIYVTPVVDQGTRKAVRDLLFMYKPTDLTKEEFELKILNAIAENHPIKNYVHITKVDIVELRF